MTTYDDSLNPFNNKGCAHLLFVIVVIIIFTLLFLFAPGKSNMPDNVKEMPQDERSYRG